MMGDLEKHVLSNLTLTCLILIFWLSQQGIFSIVRGKKVPNGCCREIQTIFGKVTSFTRTYIGFYKLVIRQLHELVNQCNRNDRAD